MDNHHTYLGTCEFDFTLLAPSFFGDGGRGLYHIWYGMIWYMLWYIFLYDILAWYMIWYVLIWYGLVWYSQWYDMWYDNDVIYDRRGFKLWIADWNLLVIIWACLCYSWWANVECERCWIILNIQNVTALFLFKSWKRYMYYLDLMDSRLCTV